MDKIRIKDLEVYSYHGVYKEENILGQKFLVSVCLYTNTRKAGVYDDLTYSINYGEVAHLVQDFMNENTYHLLETVAEQLAEKVLLTYNSVKKIMIEIKKPWAPILLPMDTVSIKIKRKWHTVYLSIGSNLGEKEENLIQAIEQLKQDIKTKVLRVSKFIITEPVGYIKQDNFLNGIVEIKTLREPMELLSLIGKIEKKGKRERLVHWGPRTIDIDIIFYDDKIIEEETLIIPHKEMHKRAFVLEPLNELAPWKEHPIFHKTVCELLNQVSKNEREGE